MSQSSWAGPLHDALANREVIVVCGTGGVGKTTVSAALAVAAARGGRRVLVMTIDPARRLASSLGIDGAFNEATAIDLSALPGEQGPLPEGAALHAMMLDAKSTWDGVVNRFAANAESRDRILGNHYYQRAAGSLAGSQEYMAMEKLLEVVRSERYDLVVLDTPPTRNALDFLEAPERMMAILQESIIKWIAPSSGRFSASRAGALLFGRGQQAMFSMFERFVGENVLRGISEFISSFSGLLDGMRSRAAEVMALLRSERAAFVLVASPSRIALSEAGVSWVPMVIERLRRSYRMVEASDCWQSDDPDPVELLHQSFYFTSLEDPSAFRMLDLIGEDRVMVESDFPHMDSTWPGCQAMLRGQLAELPRATIEKVCFGNASALYDHPLPPAELIDRSEVGGPPIAGEE